MGVFGRMGEDDNVLRDLLGGKKGGQPGEQAPQRVSLHLDLDVRACAICRRELLPWQETCPDDGGAAVRREDLPPPADPLAETLGEHLDDRADDDADERPVDETEHP